MLAVAGTRVLGAETPDMSFREWDALADRLLHSTILTYPEADFIRSLRSSLRELPPDTQQRWFSTLQARIVRKAVVRRPCGCNDDEQLVLTLGVGISTQCADCGTTFDVPRDLLCDPRLDDVRRHQARALPAGADCVSELTLRFGTLMSVSRRVTVIDRYAVGDAVRQEAKAAGTSGLRRLAEIAASGGVTELLVCVGLGGKIDGAKAGSTDLALHLRRVLSGLDPALSVRLQVLRHTHAQRMMHDRWIGFAWSTAGQWSVSLGKGVSQFDGTATSQQFSVARQDDTAVAVLASQLSSHVDLDVRIQ